MEGSRGDNAAAADGTLRQRWLRRESNLRSGRDPCVQSSEKNQVACHALSAAPTGREERTDYSDHADSKRLASIAKGSTAFASDFRRTEPNEAKKN